MVLIFVIFSSLLSLSPGQVINPLTEMYCDGDVLQIPDELLFSEQLACCGKAIHEKNSSRCCGGKVVQIPYDYLDTETYFLECCGDTWYSNVLQGRLEMCCKDMFYSPQSQICNVQTGEVLLKDDNPYQDFCNGEVFDIRYQQCSYDVYDPLKHIICEKSDNPYQHSSSCCGNKPYNPLKEQCCIDTIHPIYNSTRDELINQCCGRNVYPLPDYMLNQQIYVGRFTCCGETVVEKSSLTEECCGSIRYNTTDSLCCEGVLVTNVSFGDRCCGSSAHNTELSWCCNGNAYPLSYTPQSCNYNPNEPKDLENSDSEGIGINLWLYDRHQFSGKALFFERLDDLDIGI